MDSHSSEPSHFPVRLSAAVRSGASLADVVVAGKVEVVQGFAVPEVAMPAPPPSPAAGAAPASHLILVEPPGGDVTLEPAGSAEFGVSGRGSTSKRRRKRRRPVTRPPISQCDRVWLRCHICGQRNHVRRLFCTSCISPRRRG